MRKGGWINGSRADDNLHYDFRKLFKEAGHNVGYQPTLPIPSSPPWPSAEALGVLVAELM